VNQTSPASSGPYRTSADTGPSTRPVRPTTSRRFDELVAAAVFGVPFTYCLHGALRGELFLGRYTFFGTGTSVSGLIAWAVTTALGLLWLGVSLQLGFVPRLAERARCAWAASLILAGVAILLFGARLLSLRSGF
jgi:hypothetical protein